MPTPDNILELRNLRVEYPVRGAHGQRTVLRAVDGVDLALPRGGTLGLVGESGCGKSTLVRTIVGVQRATSGSVIVEGEDLLTLSHRALRARRSKVQVVFQDPYASLNPRMTAHDLVAEPLRINHCYNARRVGELLDQVGISTKAAGRRPAEFSGGQRQRIAIARALALSPSLLILDEPVSALDKSIQAQVLNLLAALQAELGLSYLMISHDLSVVRHVSDAVSVMYMGRIVETAPAATIFARPAHPYTQALISAVPVARFGGRRRDRPDLLRGEIPDPLTMRGGCPLRTRCVRAQDACADWEPELFPVVGDDHRAACLFPSVPVADACPESVNAVHVRRATTRVDKEKR